MAYMTEFADWFGGFLESIDNLYLVLTPPIMLLLGVITIFSTMTIFYIWVKKNAQVEV